MEENAKLRKKLEELKKETVRKYMNVDLSLKSITRKKIIDLYDRRVVASVM